MAKKSFWQSLKDFFTDEEEHLITDEEWEQMQAEEKQRREELLLDDEPLEVDNSWRCPRCHTKNPEERIFCEYCGLHPGSFRDVLDALSDEQIRLVLEGSGNLRYPAEELRLLENELLRRAGAEVPEEAPPAAGWKCVVCGQEDNPEEEYFCKNCGEYRY